MIIYIASFLKLLFLYLTFIHTLCARPVSYLGGWTFMTYNNYDSNSALLHYSPKSKYSIGYKSEYWQKKEYFLNSINLNYLIKRINKKRSQANIYVKSGLGIISSDYANYENKNEVAGHLEISTDWETRRYFVSYLSKAIKSESIDNTYIQRARFGIAPYIADYGKLHTWIMCALKHMPENEDTITPEVILRLFKSTNLMEIGLDKKKNLAFNFIKRF